MIGPAKINVVMQNAPKFFKICLIIIYAPPLMLTNYNFTIHAEFNGESYKAYRMKTLLLEPKLYDRQWLMETYHNAPPVYT